MVPSTESGSSGKRSRDEGGGSTPDTPTSGDVGDDFMPRPEGVKKAKSRLKGKGQVGEVSECVGSFTNRLQLYQSVRARDYDVEQERLQFLKEKEARKKKQMEMQREMDLYKVKWDMVAVLSSKDTLTPWEEQRLAEARDFIQKFEENM